MEAPRIAPLEPPYTPEARAELERWMPPGSGVAPLALFRTLATDAALAQAMWPLGSFLLSRRCSLSRREREIVIDRVCARCGCEYEWGVHVAAFAGAADLDEAEVAATVAPGVAGVWEEREALLVRLVDELHDSGRVGDELWHALAAHYDARQLLELLALCGWYHLISFVANGARVALEPWARRFPAAS
ncbi:MAG: carboxymuconolactone decarboxylase family protein [Thermodesulfobacteriota bacterium]